ncbi:winged helix-turn-helix transcriptional regulator [Porticoccus sp.]
MDLQEKIIFQSDAEKSVGRMVESIIGCKWSLSVLQLLRDGINRPGEMQRQVAGLTTKVLNERLAKLSRYGIIDKTVYPESPPRVEYSFTEFGRQFLQIIDVVNRVQRELDGN